MLSANVLEVSARDESFDCDSMEADEFAAVPVACDVAPWYSRVKALLEWGIAVALLILLAPLLIALAVLVKWTSTGPVFYFQTRLGRNGHPYQIVKLRTMVHDAESWTGPVWAAKNDSRITPLGRFLRDTHLDELPQLWNVLRGDMSLIGPRPERPEITARIELRIPEFRRRLQVRPGVTGLAQMLLPADDPNDKDLDGVRKKLACDVRYLQQMSPMLDLRIALCTSCYFLVAAIDAARRNLLRSHAAALTDGLMVSPAEGECERAA